MNCQLLTRSYCKLLGSLGHSIGSRPLLFLLLPPLLLGALIYPFIAEVRRYSQSEGQDDLEMLWPISSRSARDKAAMGRLFPDGPGDRSLLSPTQFVLLISSKDLGSIWRPEIVVEYNQLLTDLNSINLTENGVNYNYSRLCLVDISTGKCPVDLFLSIWEAQRNGRVRKLSYPILAFYDDNSRGDSPNSLVYIGPLLGGVITDRDGQIRYAKYVRVEWRLSTGGFHDLLLKQFSLKFTKFLAKFQSELINVNYWSAEGFKSDVAKIRSRTLRFSPLLVGVLVLFPISSAFMSSCVTSKPWLALSGVISALMGMTLAFSFLFICKVSMMDLILFIPFLILPCAIDQTFLMLNVWRKTCRCLSVPDRMRLTYTNSAVSITVTTVSAINSVVFAVGAFSPFQAVRIFCLFTSVSAFIMFLYQLSFFGACLALTGKREEAQRHCLTFRKVKPSEIPKISLDPHKEDSLTPWPDIFFRDYYAPLLVKMSVRVTIGVAYVAFVVFSIWVSLTQLNLGLKLAKLVPYDSATFRYLTALETFRYSPTSAEVVIPGRLDYFSDLEVRTKLLQFVRSLEYSDFSLNAEFWLRDCLLFLQSSAAVVNPTNFPRFVQEVFLQLPKFKHYQSAVNMATDSDGNLYISGSRFHLHLVNSGGENRSRAMEFLRKRIDQDAPVPMWIFEVSFPLSEQNDLIAVDVLQNLGIGGLCVLLISGLFSPQLLSTISIGFAVISMNIGVIAGFALWDIQLDIFALICILLSLATSVSPVVHLASQFVTVTVTEVPWMKTQSALFTVGWPILQTCLLCILAAIPLVATGSYLGFILVKTVLLVAILGLFHSLLVLPVLLITADEFLQFVLGKKQRQADTDE